MKRRVFTAAWFLALAHANAVHAEPNRAADVSLTAEVTSLRTAIAQQLVQIDEQQTALDRARRALQQQQEQLEQLAARAPRPAAESAAPVSLSVGERPREDTGPDIGALFDKPGLLTPRGHFVLDSSVQYINSSSQRVAVAGYSFIPAIVVGAIDVRDVTTETGISAASLRFGVTNRSEIELRVPYLWRHDTIRRRPLIEAATADDLFESSGSGLGDAEIAWRTQFNSPVETAPTFIGSMRVRAPTGEHAFEIPRDSATSLATRLPTGSGFWGVEAGLSAIYRTDPAVFFSSVSYLWNIARDQGGQYGRIDPGDIVGFDFGMGYSVSDRLSFTLGYEHNLVLPTDAPGSPQATRLQLGSLLFGYSLRLGEQSTLQISLGAGITAEAPDLQLSFRLPYPFPR
jgi:hypothetical protein